VTTVDERSTELLRRHGWEPGEVLGSGMEGTVVDVAEEFVAKIWHGRTRHDVIAGLEFSAALGTASMPFATPQVVDLLDDDRLLITIERKVHGKPLRPDRVAAPPAATPDAARLLGEVLDGLANAVLSPGLATLPILPGEQPFVWPGAFAASLAHLVERRFRAFPDLLRREIDGIDAFVKAVHDRLRMLSDDRVGLVHGDLIPANVLVQNGRVAGVLDFGFMTTVGDPQFDAAITASIFDMYGPNARSSEDLLTEAFLARFGHDHRRYGVYRAAYAMITNAYFSQDGADGHFAWCVRMLRRPDVRAAVLG
jgi:hypothetical protein